MARRKSINNFQPGRAGREKRLRPLFPDKVNKHFKELRFVTFGNGKPDYQVFKEQTVIAYFEAEFPDEGRWPLAGEFKYETIRWPERKWQRYCQTSSPGFYEGKPVFMISIRGDLEDAYYVDALTWCRKSQIECVGASVFRGFPKDYPDMGKGIEGLEAYILRRLKRVYGP